MHIIIPGDLTLHQLNGDACAVCGETVHPMRPMTIMQIVEVRICETRHQTHRPWCGGRHLGKDRVCRRNVGEAVEGTAITVETNLCWQGADWVQVLSGTTAKHRNTALTPEQADDIAWVLSVLTLDELRKWGHDLADAAELIRQTAREEGR